jgi:hypothetical protein
LIQLRIITFGGIKIIKIILEDDEDDLG